MDRIKKKVAKKMSKDQKDPHVHRYIVKNGVVKIKLHLEKLKKETLALNLDDQEDWKRREKILRETIKSVNVLRFILSRTTDDALIRFRQCNDVFPLVFEIGKATCAITCMISRHLSRRFSPDNRKLCCRLLEIPVIFDNVLAYLTLGKSTDLSDSATIEGILNHKIIDCRMELHRDCINFNTFVSKKVRKVLRIMELSKFRTHEGFKPFLSNVVKQFFFIQRACGLTREILKCTSENEWSSHVFEYKKMFKWMKSLLSFGIRALRRLGFDDQSLFEFNSIDIVCKQVKQCSESLTSDINLECGTKGSNTLNPLLKEIEIVCFKIVDTIELGTKCLPRGELQIEEDVSLLFSSDFDEVEEGNDEDENLSDDIDVFATNTDDDEYKNNHYYYYYYDSDDDDDDDDGRVVDYDDYYDDPINDTDFEGELTKIAPEEIEEILKSSDVDRSEIINTYTMEGFESSVNVRVAHKSAFTCPSVGGKVFNGSKWKSTKNVIVEGNHISMQIEPGEILVVHYDFPTHEKTFSTEEVKRGVTMSIPEANCAIKLPSSDGGGETIKIKVHLTDKERIKKYQEENPNEYSNITVSVGLQARSISRKEIEGAVEFPEVDEPEISIFVCMSADSQFKNWNRDILEPETKRGKTVFSVMLKEDATIYIMQIKDQNSKQSIKDPEEKLSFLKRMQNAFYTLLGIKSTCKLLTLYKVPDKIGAIIELCVLCIESKDFYLNKQARSLLENKWMQIEDGDESSDFTVRSGEEIGLKFNGNVKPKEGQNPVIKFLKNGASLAHVQLYREDNNDSRGYMFMVRKDIRIDCKKLNWGYLVEKYKAGDTLMKIDAKREELYKKIQKNPQHIVTNIFKHLSDNEIKELKKELQMTNEVHFKDRFIVRIQEQKKPLEFLASELRKIGRDNLLRDQLESMSP